MEKIIIKPLPFRGGVGGGGGLARTRPHPNPSTEARDSVEPEGEGLK
jgi:hypothetical protein